VPFIDAISLANRHRHMAPRLLDNANHCLSPLAYFIFSTFSVLSLNNGHRICGRRRLQACCTLDPGTAYTPQRHLFATACAYLYCLTPKPTAISFLPSRNIAYLNTLWLNALAHTYTTHTGYFARTLPQFSPTCYLSLPSRTDVCWLLPGRAHSGDTRCTPTCPPHSG